MKKQKMRLISWGIIFIIIVFSIFIMINGKHPETPEEIVKCIGENSVLYTRLGCHYCTLQEEMFGENYKYLNVIDCFYEIEKCSGIEGTPTWKINGENHKGLLSIDELKELTGCN